MKQGWIIIVLLVVLGLFFSGWLSEYLDDWAGGGINQGYASIALTLHYKDGTTEQIKTEEFSLVPLTIKTFLGLPVDHLYILILVKPEFTIQGQEQSIVNYHVAGTFESVVWDETETTKIADWKSEEFDRTETLPDGWESGEEKGVKYFTHYCDSLESIMATHGEGTYHLVMSVDLTLTLETDQGVSDSMRAEGSYTWAFRYEKDTLEITSISVTVGAMRFYG